MVVMVLPTVTIVSTMCNIRKRHIMPILPISSVEMVAGIETVL